MVALPIFLSHKFDLATLHMLFSYSCIFGGRPEFLNMEQDTKRYGLVFPKMVKKPSLSSKLAIFNEDDSDDERISVSAEIRKESEKNIHKKQTQIEVEKALKENPTVYEYDAIYEEMKQEKTVPKLQEKQEKKPRYIEALMKAAEIRKRENERRVEKKIQKEREAEGDEFKDKEAFVTSAYKKKLQQMQEEEENEQRKQQLEAMMDVTKQNDLSGFYRHLLKQEVGEEAVPNITKTQPNDAENKDEEQMSYETKHQSKTSEKRMSASPDLDADSDIPVNSGSEDEEQKKPRKEHHHREKFSSRSGEGKSHHSRHRSPRRRQEDEITKKKRRRSSSQETSPERHKEVTVLDKKEEPAAVADEKNVDTAENNSHNDPMQKFVKRTVGEVFEEARKRYLERRQAREGALNAIPVAS